LVTIDAAGPTSSVDPLPPETGTATFTVSWSGADDPGGSGIGSYDIFVSDNGGPFTAWLTATTATSAEFTGQFGHTYSFFSVATDNVGYREVTPTGAQASTTLRPDGDFNDDGLYDLVDIDQLVAAIAADTHAVEFDLTDDGLVDLADRDAWLVEAGGVNLPSGNPYLLGDANLDGVVDGQDFIRWNSNKFTSIAAWSAADFNADGVVDGQDFIEWNTHKFQSSDGHAPSSRPALSVRPLSRKPQGTLRAPRDWQDLRPLIVANPR
jgi:hypothetical protein